jgi:two-component system response regulator DesR
MNKTRAMRRGRLAHEQRKLEIPMSTGAATATATRIVIAEDNDDLRAVMPPLLDEYPGMQCVASTAFLDEVPSLIAQHDAEVAVLDLELRDGSTLKLLPELRNRFPATLFIIHSGHSNPELMRKARSTGADAYVVKSGDFDELVAAIRGSRGG